MFCKCIFWLQHTRAILNEKQGVLEHLTDSYVSGFVQANHTKHEFSCMEIKKNKG